MVAIPLIPFLAEAAAAAAAATASYIALNSPAVKNAIASTGRTLGDAIGKGMNAASQAIDDGIEKAKKAIAGVSNEVSTTQSCSTNTCGGGDGDDGDGKDDKKKGKGKDDLNEAQKKNLKRFEDKLPKDAKPTQIENLPDGGKIFRSEVPARNVPGSKAIYEKVVDAAGRTVKYTKTTYAPDGSIVHIKPKFP